MKNQYIFGLLLMLSVACNQDKKEEVVEVETSTNTLNVDTTALKEKIRLDLEKELSIKDSILKDSIKNIAIKKVEESKSKIAKKIVPVKKKEVVKPNPPVKKELTTEEKAINKFGGEAEKANSKEIEKKAIDKFGR